MKKVVSVDAPHFCAGLIFEGLRCVDAAPILNWAVGKQAEELSRYFRRKGWKTEVCG